MGHDHKHSSTSLPLTTDFQKVFQLMGPSLLIEKGVLFFDQCVLQIATHIEQKLFLKTISRKEQTALQLQEDVPTKLQVLGVELYVTDEMIEQSVLLLQQKGWNAEFRKAGKSSLGSSTIYISWKKPEPITTLPTEVKSETNGSEPVYNLYHR